MNLHAKGANGRLATALLICAFTLPLASGLYFLVNKERSPMGRAQRNGKKSSSPDSSASTLSGRAPDLQITSVLHHGHIVEIGGSTEPGAMVMINGEPAATMFQGNSFKHFIGPLSAGTTVVTITVQNEQGGVTTRQLAIAVD